MVRFLSPSRVHLLLVVDVVLATSRAFVDRFRYAPVRRKPFRRFSPNTFRAL